uniref:Uncharacterized protein n=1 Tax=Rhizophora mucronata TaxID=61149 RepID=A0A2P2N6X7_RHIMU
MRSGVSLSLLHPHLPVPSVTP